MILIQQLFMVWIDVDCGTEEQPDWEINSKAKPLDEAEAEAAQINAKGWITCIKPAGVTPRADGYFTNPDIHDDAEEEKAEMLKTYPRPDNYIEAVA